MTQTEQPFSQHDLNADPGASKQWRGELIGWQNWKHSSWSRSSADPQRLQNETSAYECCINKNKDEINQLPRDTINVTLIADPYKFELQYTNKTFVFRINTAHARTSDQTEIRSVVRNTLDHGYSNFLFQGPH